MKAKKIHFSLRTMMAQMTDRTGQRVTYEQIGDATGLSISTLSRIGSNAQGMVSLDTIGKLCGFFDCEPGDLFIVVADREVEEPV